MKTKKIFVGLVLNLAVYNVDAQIGIAKETVNGMSTILDFKDTSSNTKGLIIPSVDSAPSTLTNEDNGTFIFDKSDSIIKIYENNIWKNLSDVGNSSSVFANISLETGTKVIIGNPTSNAKGVLILESPDKAMILPLIGNPHINVKKPYPGMICYDTVSKSLSVFDGLVWSYWK